MINQLIIMNFVRKLNKSRYWITLGCVYLVIKCVYTIYQDKTEHWYEQAVHAFEEILQQEMLKHDTISMTYGKCDIGSKEKCNFWYPIVTQVPLDADSLNRAWRESLYDVDIPMKTSIRISISKENNNSSLYYSKPSFKPSVKDSLFSFYLGTHREVEVTGFVSYHWWNVFDGRLPIMVILLLAGYFIPGFLFVKVLQMSKLSFLKRQVFVPKHDEMTNVIVKSERLPIYQLEEELFFDVHQRILKKGDDIEKLTPQQAMLLEAFLKAEQYKLTQKEIDILLWPDGSGTVERLYTAISRLRKSLERMSFFQVDCQIDIYQLKRVCFSEEDKSSCIQSINKLDDER